MTLSKDVVFWIPKNEQEYSENGAATILARYPNAIQGKLKKEISSNYVSLWSVDNVVVAKLRVLDLWEYHYYPEKKTELKNLGYVFYDNLVQKPNGFEIISDDCFEQVNLAIKDYLDQSIGGYTSDKTKLLLFEIWKLLDSLTLEDSEYSDRQLIEKSVSLITQKINLPPHILRHHYNVYHCNKTMTKKDG
jgi:hypothetical protein